MDVQKYVIGCDFGTLSGRAIIARTDTGEILADCKCNYKHGVITKKLNNKINLPDMWALQDPQDYLDVLGNIVPEVIRKSGINKNNIIGICIDFTAATVMPITKDGTPLCFLTEFSNNPNAYVKLWKHHGAIEEAKHIKKILTAHDPEWLQEGSQIISPETHLSKVLEILNKAPNIYEKAAYFTEAGDWLTSMICGKLCQSICSASFKGIYSTQKGYLNDNILTEINEGLRNYRTEKWNYPIVSVGSRIGYVTEKASQWLGLPTTCAVSVATIDGHAATPSCGINDDHTMLIILGTSSTHIVISKKYKQIPGICGIAKDATYKGFYTYETGQCSVGDLYQWAADNIAPYEYYCEAKEKNINMQQLLTEKAKNIKSGRSGLISLDWWNGNRSLLMDGQMKGIMLGMTLDTKPEQIYMSLIEATAMGARTILEQYNKYGFSINLLRATGGICEKNPFAMQIYADIMKIPIQLGGLHYGSALGSAIYASLAAGSNAGGYDDIFEAVNCMQDISDIVYQPNPLKTEYYDKMYEDYLYLSNLFGNERKDIMHNLSTI